MVFGPSPLLVLLLNIAMSGNAIVIFENSLSGSIEDTMIPARQRWESRWVSDLHVDRLGTIIDGRVTEEIAFLPGIGVF